MHKKQLNKPDDYVSSKVKDCDYFKLEFLESLKKDNPFGNHAAAAAAEAKAVSL